MEQPQEQRDLVAKIAGRFHAADQGVHKRFRDRANHFVGLYHNYTQWKNGLPVDRRDRDTALQSAKREWGAELFIPYAYSIVETILARMLSNRPSVLILPRGPESEMNVQNMKWTIEAQYEKLNYELILQRIARNALQMGLGVQKTYWKFEERTKKVVQPRTLKLPAMSDFVVRQVADNYDDPMIESVDPFDWFWDPMGSTVQECEWVIHRTWRSTDYCLSMLRSNTWTGIQESDINEGSSGNNRYTEAFSQRLTIAGYPNFTARDTHEVWEYHDGSKVVTVLDRQWVVQQGDNPAWHGELPFQVYRPTPVDGRMVGIGEIEPIEDLQAEINTLRSQRRDNATVVLQKAFFYADGSIDPNDFKIGPGRGVPTFGPPGDSILPIEFGEIPNSGYREEQSLQADIERATGIDDSLSGSGGPQQTATGVQLVQAAANLRIQQKTRNCEIELVREGGRQVLALNQQRILTNKTVRIPAEPTPENPERRWAWRKVGPLELAGEFDIDIEGGSMAPENVPQMRQDAQTWIALLGNQQIGPYLDQPQVLRKILFAMGEKNPESMIVQPAQQVSQDTVQTFQKALAAQNVSPQLIQQAWAASQNGGVKNAA